MACPYFIPTERLDLGWQHAERLPLAAGWSGVCGAPGQMLARPADDDLRDCCNLGYARCTRLPEDRTADAVRFAARMSGQKRICVRYVFEKQYLPASEGTLEYDESNERWVTPAENDTLQRQAECFLSAWRARRQQSYAAGQS